MYASVRKYQVDPKNIGEIVERVQEGFVPSISKAPGFYAFYAVDAGDGVALSISVFEEKAGAEQSNRMAADWVGENLAPLMPNPPEVTVGDVKVYEVV